MSNKEAYFFCYNIRLANYLIGREFRFITKAYTKDSKAFFLFESTDILTNAIQDYKRMG